MTVTTKTMSKLELPKTLKQKITAVCQKKIAAKGENVGVSFYAFFANKNDDPELLMTMATWWISAHQLDHFVKAKHILTLIDEK